MRATREMQDAARIARDDFLMHIDANDQIGALNVALEAALEVADRNERRMLRHLLDGRAGTRAEVRAYLEESEPE